VEGGTEKRRDRKVKGEEGHSFKTSVTHPLPSIIYFPLHVMHLSCLGSEQPHGLYVLYITHQKYCSFINYALNHYQVSPSNY